MSVQLKRTNCEAQSFVVKPYRFIEKNINNILMTVQWSGHFGEEYKHRQGTGQYQEHL